MKALKALLAVFGLAGAVAQVRRFDGDVILRCNFDFSDINHNKLYQTLLDQGREDVDFLGRNDIHLTSESFLPVTSALEALNVSCHTLVKDVQALVDAEREYTRLIRTQETNAEAYQFGDPNPDPFFNDYRTNDEIDTWCNNLARTYPTVVNYTRIGTSYQNRTLMVLKITNGAEGRKPVIFYEGGIHAREWISPATVLYIAGKLTRPGENYSQALLDKYEFHIVPVVNRDGYNYTWTTDRSWRKTRKPNAGSACIGTDPNRNWDDHWCEQGASRQPCSDSYCGSAAFTEPEVVAMANWIGAIQNSNAPKVRMFVDWHAYGQLWMAPWGWSGATPPDGAAQATAGNLALKAIKDTNGLTYQYGTIYNIIYPASGSSADYFYDVHKIIYAYGVELRDTGQYGFTLPASQIRPQGEEIWSATVAVANSI